jgi:transcriptional regulator with XRE-family HTH domain
MPAVSYPMMRRLVRALRLKYGLTQEMLAEKAGLDYKYYQRLELGLTATPTLVTLEGLGRALRIKPWVLICDEATLITAKTGITELNRRATSGRGRPRKGHV